MAAIDQRGGSYRVRWRMNGSPPTTTLDKLQNAERARQLAEAHRQPVDKWFT